MTPHKCPICNGTTKVPKGFYGDMPVDATSAEDCYEPCRTCTNGIVWAEEPEPIQCPHNYQPLWTGPGYIQIQDEGKYNFTPSTTITSTHSCICGKTKNSD